MSIKLKRKIFYWSPSLVNIATNKAVINSCYSIIKFNKSFECFILNFFGEFNKYTDEIHKKKISLINYYDKIFLNYFPRHGKFKSRFSFFIIYLASFFPLKNLLIREKPEYLIIHLISSLPLTLLLLFKFDTKFILRISGLPKLNFLRKFIWKMAFKKIHLVTCPTINTLNYIKNLNIIEESKLKLLYDPIIIVNEINKKKNIEINYKNYYLSVGRLTPQKNFVFLCKAFNELVKLDKKNKLLIAGDGEEQSKLSKFIKRNNLSKNIFLLGHVENIYPYFKKSKGFILSSLWEDPGFVLIESSFCRTPILSSDSWPGPIELIQDNFNGYLYKNNNMKSFLDAFNKLSLNNGKNIKLNALKMSKKFTLFKHYDHLIKLIN